MNCYPPLVLASLGTASFLGSCAPDTSEASDHESLLGTKQQELHGITPECEPNELNGTDEIFCRLVRGLEGRRLFDLEDFGGNGRACVTCHSPATGTISPDDVHERLINPADALFIHDALDEDGAGTNRLEADATIRVRLVLPSYVTVAGDPDASHIDVFRGVPTTQNTPAFDPVLMLDGREKTLESQALGAISGHAQNAVEPTDNELELIAEFQRTSLRFFSSLPLRLYALGAAAPQLPIGSTPSEQRGRLFFIDAPFEPPSTVGVCGLCHSGPMLNETNSFGAEVFPAPEGSRFHNILVDLANGNDYPVHDLLVEDGLGNVVPVSTPDPGMLLIPELLPPPGTLPRSIFAGFFKTPQLWGIRRTGPYFHDNSAKTLEEVVDHYQFFFDTHPIIAGSGVVFTEQDRQDIVAFMNLL